MINEPVENIFVLCTLLNIFRNCGKRVQNLNNSVGQQNSVNKMHIHILREKKLILNIEK